jgi:hypothetical protein
MTNDSRTGHYRPRLTRLDNPERAGWPVRHVAKPIRARSPDVSTDLVLVA